MGQGLRWWQSTAGRVAIVIAIVCALLGQARHAAAQAVKGSIMSVGIGGHDGKEGFYREGDWVPVQVQLKNMTPSAFTGRLGVTQVDLDGDKALSLGPEFILQPGVEARTLWTYYWPRPDINSAPGGISEITVYQGDTPVAKVSIPGANHGGDGQATSIKPDEDNFNKVAALHRSTRLVVVLGDSFAGWKAFEGMTGGTEAVRPTLVRANGIPDDVKGLDAVDLMVWEADSVKVSELHAEFELQAILDWVRSGGHLIISVGTQGQEFAKAPASLQSAMPISLALTREVKPAELAVSTSAFRWNYDSREIGAAPLKNIVQAIGEMKPGSRAVPGTANANFTDNPIAVTGMYGRGAVTVITFNVANPEFKLSEKQSIAFWSQMAGWQNGDVTNGSLPAADFNNLRNDAPQKVANAHPFRLGTTIPQDVDVKDVTAVRILVAVLFLAIYWLLAGPIGHLILRHYRVVHWSWWIFGAVVLAATAVAGTVVLVLHVNAYDVRHRSFVIGTVGSPEVTVTSYYGVYAPVSGPLAISQPHGEFHGVNYLAPLCFPNEAELKSYADPQGYEMDLNPPKPGQDLTIRPVFRNTLKKLQGRWTGNIGKIDGSAEFISTSADLRHVVKGRLTNNCGYDLDGVELVVSVPRTPPTSFGTTYLYHLPQMARWKQGETISLEDLVLDELGRQNKAPRPGTVEQALAALGYVFGKEDIINHMGGWPSLPLYDNQDEVVLTLRNRTAWRDDLLYTLLDLRPIDDLSYTNRYEPVRGPARFTDCTKLLKVGCGLIVAHAGDAKTSVKSPVPLKVNDKLVEGKGQILFAWALPIAGKVPSAAVVIDPQPGAPAPGRGRGAASNPSVEAP
ncbi:MAG TPA: hypothetical protein VHM90_19925 [Phycisphaerae bacterium]|nr:hypothetical protein [Phycisphaerae bacterium]